MRQYKIWNAIRTVGGRKSSCDYGANTSDHRAIYVGTSSRNSHPFATVTTECHERGDGTYDFTLWVDGNIVKHAVLSKKELTFKELN